MNENAFYYSDLFKKIANEQKILLNNSMTEQGMTYVQSLVILYLLDTQKHSGAEHEVSQRDLERYLSLKGPTVTNILNRMEENGFIVRTRSERDSRVNRIQPTELGMALIPNFYNVLNHVESIMTNGMTEGEQMQLKLLLQKVLTNLEDNKC